MTRINVVPVQELHPKHLVAEYREIVRVFALVRKRVQAKKPLADHPFEYTLGTGHVKFFFDKLTYISNRYKELTQEMINRGYNPNPIPLETLHAGIPRLYFFDWEPTEEALRINRQRIKERMPK